MSRQLVVIGRRRPKATEGFDELQNRESSANIWIVGMGRGYSLYTHQAAEGRGLSGRSYTVRAD